MTTAVKMPRELTKITKAEITSVSAKVVLVEMQTALVLAVL